MKIPPFLNPAALCKMQEGIVVKNARLLAEDSPFADDYVPDQSKAFVEFDICHTLPDYLGPVSFGTGKVKGKDYKVANFCGFFPDTIEASHESLQYQQLNLRHLLTAYDESDGPNKKIRNDSIVGCIVATQVPRKPQSGWRTPGNPKGATSSIRACAVVFKLAKGINRLMGDHLTGRNEQSVSIEVTTPYDNMGVYIPSQDTIVPLIEPGEEVFSAYQIVQGVLMPQIGKMKTDANPDGEQLIVTYGLDGKPVHFNGVGVTPTPAEKAAKITRMNAEACMIGMCAQSIFETMRGQKVTFSSGRIGEIYSVVLDGGTRSRTSGSRRTGTETDPVLRISVGRDDLVLNYSELAGKV